MAARKPPGSLLGSTRTFLLIPFSSSTRPLLVVPPSPPLQTFLPLLILGMVFSSIFLYTRNLLPPIILHSAWNIFVLMNLLFRPA